jgi:PAS domain S-box-containing protein
MLQLKLLKLDDLNNKFRDFFDFSPIGYFVLDKNVRILQVNLAGASMVGLDRDLLIKKRFSLYINKKDKDILSENLQEVTDTSSRRQCELRMINKENGDFFAELLIDPVVDSKSQVSCCCITAIDISARKNAEKQAESLAKFPNENPYPVLRIAKDGTIVYSNKPGEVLLEEWKCHIGQKAPGNWRTLFNRALKSNQYLVKEISCGQTIFSFAAAPVPDDGYVNLYGRNLTQKKHALEQLQQSEKKYRRLFNTMTEGFALHEIICDKKGKPHDYRFLEVNPAFEVLTGLKAKEIVGKTVRQIIPDIEQFWIKEYGEVALSGRSKNFESFSKSLGKYYEVFVYRPAPMQFAVLFIDITDRKKAEETIQIASERLVLAQRSAGAGIWDWNIQTGKLNWSPELFMLFGLDCSKEEANFDSWNRVLHPDDKQIASDAIETAIREHKPLASEYRVILHDGNVRWINALGNTIYDTDGKAIRMSGICIDISGHKKAEEEIKNLAKFPQENPFPVLRIKDDGTIIYSNNPGLVILKEWGRKIGQKVPNSWISPIKNSLQYNRQFTEQIKCGQNIFSLTIAPILDAGYVNLYGRDIAIQEQIKDELRRARDELDLKVHQRTTELAQTIAILQKEIKDRVAAETKLRESTKVLDAFFAHSITPLVILDKKFNFIRVNKAYADSCGKNINDFEGHNHFEFFPHEENERIFKQVVMTKQPYQTLAKPFSFPDRPELGVTYWDWTLVPILGENENVEFLVFSLKDVTQRKRAELAMKAERQRMNDVLETLPAYVCLLKPDYQMPFANRVFRESFGYVPDKKCYEFLFNRTEPCEDCQTFTVLKTNKTHHWEWTGPNNRDYDVFDFPFEDTDGSQLILEMGMDVTERNHAEKRNKIMTDLLEQFVKKGSRKEYLDSVVKILHDWSGCRGVGIRLVNSDGFIPYVSCVGFSKEFLSLESNLCLSKDACACIRVIAQKLEPQDARVMTEKGSFHCGNSFKFVDALPGNEKKRFRGNCLKAGFATISIVPVRYREEILGAIHIADEGENKVPPETVKFLEDMAALIGEAVHRFNVEEALVLNEQRLLNAQRVTHIGNWEWDIIKNRLWWSDEIYSIFGLEPKQFCVTYDTFLSIVHPEDRKLVEESVNKAVYDGQAYDIDHRVIRNDRSIRTVNERAEVIYDSHHKPVRMIGTVHDITERKKAEDEIRKNQLELRTLSAKLQLAEEQERRRIAQDLHDSIGQILAFSGRELKTLQKSVPEKAAKAIDEIAKQLDLAVTQARTLSFDLSPSILYDLGFEVAVEDLVDRISKERGIECDFKNSPQPKPLTDDVKVLLYRSIRELLINSVKHSKAEHVKVSLLRSSSDIYIQVEDDGCGFDMSILSDSSTKRKGFGIFSIRERLNHIGGQLKIESAKDKGTKTVIIAPLNIESEKQKE